MAKQKLTRSRGRGTNQANHISESQLSDKKHLDAKLDSALAQTFPASDPVDLTPDHTRTPIGSYASPACFSHELEPSLLGYIEAPELIGLLQELLQGEKAGARGLRQLANRATTSDVKVILKNIAKDEARFCAMLQKHIVRLGGVPSSETGAFYEKLLSLTTLREQLSFLNRGQAWVVRKLQDVLGKIDDEALLSDLKEMAEIHESNIELCTRIDSTP